MPAPLIDVVIPARDDAATLKSLLRDLPSRAIRSVVVVDRASTDRTAEIARDAGALVLREPGGGYGAACLRAQAHFSSLPRVPDVVVFLPGDRPAAAAAIPSLVAPIAGLGVPPAGSAPEWGRGSIAGLGVPPAGSAPEWGRGSIDDRGIELVLGGEPGRRALGAKLLTGLIDTVYRHRWSGVGPVRAIRFPALIALGMSDRGDGWDVEMLVRAAKLGLSCDEVALPAEAEPPAKPRSLARALFHIARHATMR